MQFYLNLNLYIAGDRTYHFMSETEEEADEWISVLNNSKKYALEAVFDNDNSSPNDVPNKGLQELTQSIVREVKLLPGNDSCCDCSTPGNLKGLKSAYCSVPM